MNEQTLELQIQATSKEALNTVNKLVSLLTNVDKNIDSINNKINTSNSSIKTASKTIDSVKSSTDKATNSANKLGNAFKNAFTFAGAKKLSTIFYKWVNEAINYTEQLNLFNVVFDNAEKDGKKMFSNLGLEATKFQNKLNEAFGTNKTETLYMQGIYQSMGETVGIDETYSAIMSETMTKLTYDLASLYNKSEDKVAEALRAGVYAGQTKPLRNYGIDVTYNSLQPVLDSLGIDEQVKNLSQAEKEILRYIATLKQASISMGDFANNLESPSNQLKIFKQQLVEAKVALSSLFIGTFANILPYANAILMVIKEISSAIATMFGIELTDYNTGIASQEGIYDGIADSVDNATDSVKELKRQTLGFDEIHNINENNNSGSSGTSVSGGIDQRLLDAITGYDNGMDKVKMKATEIRDKIMEWLGFTKVIDPLTGKVSFKYEGIKNALKNMWDSFLGLSTEGKILVGIIGAIAAYKLYDNITKIIKKILGVDDLITLNGKKLTAFGKIVKSLKISGWSTTISKVLTKLKSALSIVGKVTIGVAGLTTAIIGANGTYNAMKKMTEEANYGGTEFRKYTVSILETVGGATALGTVLGGPLGGAIGALTGTIVAGISALFGYKEGIKELAKDDLFGDVSISTAQWSEMLDNLNISINDNTERFETLKTNLSTLGSSFEENADKLDFYGMKFGTLAQKITEEDATNIKNAIQEMCDSSIAIIDETTNYDLEIWSSTFSRMSTLTEEEEKDILNSIYDYGKSQKAELEATQNRITMIYDNAMKERGYLTDEEYNYIQQQLQKIRELTNNEMSRSQTDIEYYKTVFADKNKKLDEQSYKDYQTALEEYNTEKKNAIAENYNQLIQSAENFYKNNQDKYDEYLGMKAAAAKQRSDDEIALQEEIQDFTDSVTESLKEKYKLLLKDNIIQAKEEKKLIEGILDEKTIEELKKNYGNAGKTSANAFSEKLNPILDDTTLKLANLNKTSTTIKITADTSDADWKLSNLSNKMQNLIGNNGTSGIYSILGKASGGVYSNGSWKNIPQYANGGIPSHGSMFVAGEAGAEIVGHINGRTEVLNQSQIASAIYSAVYSAMSQFSGGGIAEINVHADEGIIVETAINGINQKTKQTGVCPVNIPIY